MLELPVLEFAPDGSSRIADLGSPMAYKTDGEEHIMLPLNPMVSTKGRTTINALAGGPYRVTWKDNSLVITGSEQIPYGSFRNEPIVEFVRRLFSISFSLNPDGTLLIERTIERDPSDIGRIEVRKAVLKSVYRKAS